MVDNASEDGSANLISLKYPELLLFKNEENLGFSGGNNIGIDYAVEEGSDYVYLLNNDTEVDPDFLNEIVEVAEKDKNIGVAGSTAYYFEPSDIVWYSGGHANWTSGDMLDPRVGKKINTDLCSIEDVDEVAGAGMLIRASSIKKVGTLNADFFIYFEETDLCQRIKKLGERVVWVPKSIIWHKVSMAFGEESPVMIYLMTRNRWLFMSLNAPNFLLFSIHFFLRSTRNYFRYIMKNKPKLANALLTGIKDAISKNYGKGQIEKFR